MLSFSLSASYLSIASLSITGITSCSSCSSSLGTGKFTTSIGRAVSVGEGRLGRAGSSTVGKGRLGRGGVGVGVGWGVGCVGVITGCVSATVFACFTIFASFATLSCSSNISM
jgi:hypothetical protein